MYDRPFHIAYVTWHEVNALRKNTQQIEQEWRQHPFGYSFETFRSLHTNFIKLFLIYDPFKLFIEYSRNKLIVFGHTAIINSRDVARTPVVRNKTSQLNNRNIATACSSHTHTHAHEFDVIGCGMVFIVGFFDRTENKITSQLYRYVVVVPICIGVAKKMRDEIDAIERKTVNKSCCLALFLWLIC